MANPLIQLGPGGDFTTRYRASKAIRGGMVAETASSHDSNSDRESSQFHHQDGRPHQQLANEDDQAAYRENGVEHESPSDLQQRLPRHRPQTLLDRLLGIYRPQQPSVVSSRATASTANNLPLTAMASSKLRAAVGWLASQDALISVCIQKASVLHTKLAEAEDHVKPTNSLKFVHPSTVDAVEYGGCLVAARNARHEDLSAIAADDMSECPTTNTHFREKIAHESHTQTTQHSEEHPRHTDRAWLFADDAGARRRIRRQQSDDLRARRSTDQKGRPDSRTKQGTLFIAYG